MKKKIQKKKKSLNHKNEQKDEQKSPQPAQTAFSNPSFSSNATDFLSFLDKGFSHFKTWSAPFAAMAATAKTIPIIPPATLEKLQCDYIRDYTLLWRADVLELADKRFSGEAWKENSAHRFLAALYLLNARYMRALADAVVADFKTQERVRFVVEQWIAAAAPSNFLVFNPDAQTALLESHGASLKQGMLNMWADLARGKVSQTDLTGFVVGENIATTAGAVVYENDLIQLIQYKPLTDDVFANPLLFVPPCINKYYILDLRHQHSLVEHALMAGHSVYMISWRNPGEELAHKTWDDYIDEGVLSALNVVEKLAHGAPINTLGFCIGGTLLACALAIEAARKKNRAASMTLITAMLDFSHTGLLDIFIDDAYVKMREHSIGGQGKVPPGLVYGSEFLTAFSYLRPNELVWHYVVDNYLKGISPPPFDLLYWNNDSTNLPGPMYSWYLRKTYLENQLCIPNAVKIKGESLDFGKIKASTFIYASRDDHIVPWRSAYASVSLLKSDKTFVLGASGHVAGVVNPPIKNKRNYWVSEKKGALPIDADDWEKQAVWQQGSWWPAWTEWLTQYGGKKNKAFKELGSKEYPVIEAAPGRYVFNQ